MCSMRSSSRRNTKAAKRLLTRLLKKQGLAPKRMITDKLRSYGAAKRQVMPDVEHWSHKGLNNRSENSHAPRPKTGADDAGLSIVGRPAALRLYLLCPQKSLRSAPLKPLCSRHTHSSPAGHGGMEGCDRNVRLNSEAAALIRSISDNVTSPGMIEPESLVDTDLTTEEPVRAHGSGFVHSRLLLRQDEYLVGVTTAIKTASKETSTDAIGSIWSAWNSQFDMSLANKVRILGKVPGLPPPGVPAAHTEACVLRGLRVRRPAPSAVCRERPRLHGRFDDEPPAETPDVRAQPALIVQEKRLRGGSGQPRPSRMTASGRKAVARPLRRNGSHGSKLSFLGMAASRATRGTSGPASLLIVLNWP